MADDADNIKPIHSKHHEQILFRDETWFHHLKPLRLQHNTQHSLRLTLEFNDFKDNTLLQKSEIVIIELHIEH